MIGPVARYTSSRWYSSLALLAFGCALVAGWLALRWPFAVLAAAVFALAAIVAAVLALRPPIEIHESHLLIGRRAIAWREIRRVDLTRAQTASRTPLVVVLTLEDQTRILLIHAGHRVSSRDLLRQLRRCSHKSLIDGVPYRQFWGIPNPEPGRPRRAHVHADNLQVPQPHVPAAAPRDILAATSAKAPLLLPEDEAEVERLFQRLKSAGRLDTPSLPQ